MNYIEEKVSYIRRRQQYTCTCELDACPFCDNRSFITTSHRRRWCSIEAHLEYLRRTRAEEAINAGRNPGQQGVPKVALFQHCAWFGIRQETEQVYYFDILSQEPDDDSQWVYLAQVRGAQNLRKKCQRFFKRFKKDGVYLLDQAYLQVCQRIIDEHCRAFPLKGESL